MFFFEKSVLVGSVRYFEVFGDIDSEGAGANKVAFKSDRVSADPVGWCAEAYKMTQADILYFAQILEAGAAAYKILGAFHLRNDSLNLAALTFSQLHGRPFFAINSNYNYHHYIKQRYLLQ
jgi:hypothetical protein